MLLNIDYTGKKVNKVHEFDFAGKFAKLTKQEIYIFPPEMYEYEIIRIQPNGKMWGGREYETDNEYEYFDDYTLLNKNNIKKLIKAYN